MGTKKPEYPQEFRRSIVAMWRGWEGTQDEFAEKTGVCSRTLRRWLRRTEAEEAIEEARKAGAVPIRDLEVNRLKREIAHLKDANAALQASVNFLAARRRK